MFRLTFGCVVCVSVAWANWDSRSLAADLDFERDIQPILAEHCAKCHGADESTREGGLRLDVRDAALRGGESEEPAIVPGAPDKSELIRRITSPDADLVMPPPGEQKPLNQDQIARLTAWVEQGAPYAVHWAFVPPRKASLPANVPAHPVDAWVADKLRARGLPASPSASPEVLCRRLYLDVVGLPPGPEELAAFEREGFEPTLEKLLRSERYGEKWARHWLDVARYSDTNGYEKDLPRDQWVWRDWVIRALNDDLPYNQFLVEQIAGDLLPNPTQSQIVATGFLRNSMINEEGAIVPEQFRMVEMFDRMDCIGKAILGLTTQCAQCHSHKFDPLTQHEYYGMFAFLNNSYEAQSWVYTEEQRRQIEELHRGIARVEEQLRAARPDWPQEYTAWERAVRQAEVAWTPLIAKELGSVSGLNHPTQESDSSVLMLGHTSSDVYFIAQPELEQVTGLRLEALVHRDLPSGGPGRGKTGTWGIMELEVLVRKPDSSSWDKIQLVNATADFSEPEQKRDEKKLLGPVRFLIDGSDDTTWQADRGLGRRNQPSVAVVQFEKPLTMPAGSQLKIAMRMTEMLGCCRFSLTTAERPVAAPVDYAAIQALRVPADQRSEAERSTLFAAWRQSVPAYQPWNDEIAALWKTYPQAWTSVLHLAERGPDKRRETHFLERGAWDQPRQQVEPHTPAIFHSMAEDAPRNRLGFARWLADDRSPLTARVAVNRVWQAVFGEGLVVTPEDFGTRAPVPEYRELLDWLAVDFMEHGWSQKHLLRTILTSVTYQQSSAATSAQMEADPLNRLLARGPRFRAEAEVVRDIALSVSGLLVHKMGGPGVIPPVPQNVLDYNFTYPKYWTPAGAPDRYRRAVYGFRKRSMPDPVMAAFDGPNGDFACARRVRSNTPMAALTALNEPIFVEASRALALRVLREGGADDAHRAAYAFRLCTGRHPSSAEQDEVLRLLQSQRQRLADGWLNPREITTGDAGKLPELPAAITPQDAAAWTLAGRVLLNLDETLTKP
ncbi:MAG: PSD1 and planctomycete cytochrome C domain-containing protein [Pirellulaceae bacterium]